MTKNTMNRREFLRDCSLKAAGAGLVINQLAAKPVLSAQKEPASKQPGEMRIEYRTLGKTGLNVATVSFGVMRLKEPAVLFKALDLGVNFFDTAHGYQNGNNEKMLGKVAKEYGRKKILIATKAQPLHLKKEIPEKLREFAKKTLDEKFEESLKRLQTDYVDIFFVHNIQDKSWPLNQEILAFVEKIKKQGKARFVGMSIHEATCYVDAIDQTIKEFDSSSKPPHVLIQILNNLQGRLDMCSELIEGMVASRKAMSINTVAEEFDHISSTVRA